MNQPTYLPAEMPARYTGCEVLRARDTLGHVYLYAVPDLSRASGRLIMRRVIGQVFRGDVPPLVGLGLAYFVRARFRGETSRR